MYSYYLGSGLSLVCCLFRVCYNVQIWFRSYALSQGSINFIKLQPDMNILTF